MADDRARLRINLTAREFEIEGPQAFVQRYGERIESLLVRLSEDAPAVDSGLAPKAEDIPAPVPGSAERSFGEWMHLMPRTASDVDRMLLAGHFAQTRSREQAFTTGEASGLLADQGIKIGNPSQSLKQNLNARRVFKHQGRYRVSQIGIEHLRKIIGEAVPL